MNLRCANCSGTIRLERDEAFLQCPYCGSTLVVDRARTFRSFLLPPAITPTHAEALLQEELASHEVPRSPVLSAKGFLLPFWGVRGESLQETLPAFSPVPNPLSGYRLPSAGAVPSAGSDVEGFDSVACSVSSSGAWEGSPDVSAFARYRVPFYRIDYGTREASYTAWVEAVSGRVYLDRTPPALSHAITRRFWLALTGLFALFTLEGLLVPGFGWSLLAVAATAAALVPLVGGRLLGGSR